MVLKEKNCLALAPKKKYVLSQNACFPLAVLRTDPAFVNWYYSNYMMPIAARGEVSSPIILEEADALSYGEGSNVYSKVMKMSNIGIDVCNQIQNIEIVLKKHICVEYYCVLFLDFYYLNCVKKSYKMNHFIHELLFYGYDDTRQIFNAYGYIDGAYRRVEILYIEIKDAFSSALEYITNGWDRYMLVTMRLYYHGAGYQYPFPNRKFIEKLTSYVESEVSEEFKCDNLMYLNTPDKKDYRVGISITDFLVEDIEWWKNGIVDQDSSKFTCIQQRAFNCYQAYHIDIYERLIYAAEINGLEGELKKYAQSYYDKVVKLTDMIRMLYIKVECMVNKNLSVMSVLDHISALLKEVKENELLILKKYLDMFVAQNLPAEVLNTKSEYID